MIQFSYHHHTFFVTVTEPAGVREMSYPKAGSALKKIWELKHG